MFYVFKHEEFKSCNDCPMQSDDTVNCQLTGLEIMEYQQGPGHEECPLKRTGICSAIPKAVK